MLINNIQSSIAQKELPRSSTEETTPKNNLKKTTVIENETLELSKNDNTKKNIQYENLENNISKIDTLPTTDSFNHIESKSIDPKNIHNRIIRSSENELLTQLANRFKSDILTIKSSYSSNKYNWLNKNESTLSWWIENKWKGTNDKSIPLPIGQEENNILSFNNKKYIFINSFYWEIIEDIKNVTYFIKNKNGEQIKIHHDTNNWYLSEWDQQRIYVYEKNDDLNKIKHENNSIIDKILQLIFHKNPSETINNALRYAYNELLILIAINIDNKIVCIDLLKLRKILSLVTNNQDTTIINDNEMRILNSVSMQTHIDNIKKLVCETYPTEIDTEKYIENLHNYYTPTPLPEEINKKDNLLIIKGIAHSERLIHSRSSLSPIEIVWDTIFNITKDELLLKGKKLLSPIDKDELISLNIAKHHSFSLLKHIKIYTPMLKKVNEININDFDLEEKNDFYILKESKKLALSIYYKIHENVNIDSLKLNDAQLIIEHDRITSLDNDISDILEYITSAVFYKLNHTYNINAFDFLKSRIFHSQKITKLIKDIYTFTADEPKNYISSNNFKSSKECNSQSEFTSQFNSYVDNGSSEYESKLLTPFFISQLNIYPETLSYQPIRWFSLQLTIEETRSKDLRWPIKSYKTLTEKINIIKLKDADYIIIKALNGDLQVNLVKGVIFETLLEEEKNQHSSEYLPFVEKSFLTDLIIGDKFESNNSSIKYRLKIDKEYAPPPLVKESIQKSIHSCLNEISTYKKTKLDIKGIFQNIAESFIPFYREFYYKMTDKHYKVDKFSIIMDVIFIGSSLSQSGIPLKEISNKTLMGINKLYHTGKEKKLSRANLAEFISRLVSKNKMIDEYIQLDNSLVDIVSPIKHREVSNSILNYQGNIVRIESEVYDIISQYKESDIQLEPCTQQGRFKGIYREISGHHSPHTNYYIKNQNDIYKVNWDANLYTWRIIENDNQIGLGYGPAIIYVSENKWRYNIEIGLLGGGVESDNLIESVVDINAEASTSTSTPLSRGISANIPHLRDNSLFNKEPLKNTKQLKKIKKNLTSAQKKAIKKIKSANRMVINIRYSSRVRELLKIFTNRQNEQKFSELLNKIEEALTSTNLTENTLFVNDEESNLLAQMTPYAQNNGKYIAINYSAYKKSIINIISNKEIASSSTRSRLAKDNLSRTIIHEFSHIVENTTDTAGYIELLHLDGKHDITKLLIKSKLGLPEVSNNADALTEIIIILSKSSNDENYLNDFLDHYKQWEFIMDERIRELTPVIRKTVEDNTNLVWETTVKAQIIQLNEAFNIEMSKRLISEIDDNKKIFFDLCGPLNEYEK